MYYDKYIKYKKKYKLLQKGGVRYNIKFYSIYNNGQYESFDNKGISHVYSNNCMFISLLTFLQIKNPELSIEDLRKIAGLKEDTRQVEYDIFNKKFNNSLQNISTKFNINIKIIDVTNIEYINDLYNDTFDALNKNIVLLVGDETYKETVFIASFGRHFQLINAIVNEDTENILYNLTVNNHKIYKDISNEIMKYTQLQEYINIQKKNNIKENTNKQIKEKINKMKDMYKKMKINMKKLKENLKELTESEEKDPEIDELLFNTNLDEIEKQKSKIKLYKEEIKKAIKLYIERDVRDKALYNKKINLLDKIKKKIFIIIKTLYQINNIINEKVKYIEEEKNLEDPIYDIEDKKMFLSNIAKNQADDDIRIRQLETIIENNKMSIMKINENLTKIEENLISI